MPKSLDLSLFGFERRKERFVAQADRARDIGQWQLAAQLYRNALDRNPDNALIWVRYGDSLEQCGDLAQAESAYRTAIAREPSTADSYRRLGDFLRFQGRDKEANASYLMAVVLEPSLLSSLYASSVFGWSEPQVAALQELLGAPSTRATGIADPGGYKSLDWLLSSQPTTEDSQFFVSVSQFTGFNQKLFLSCSYKHEHKPVQSIYVVFKCGVFVGPVDPHNGEVVEYSAVIDIPHDANHEMKLGFEFGDGSRFIVERPSTGEGSGDSGCKVFVAFTEIVRSSGHSNVLEIGSRARSGNIYKSFLPEGSQYTGFDIKAGVNVDVVGDAHSLSSFFPRNSFDFVYSIAVFEHIMMPWKVAVEMNRVMKTGAIGFVFSHQTWTLHEQPWDFWRFSDMGWHAIFNRYTGFEIIETGLSDRARIVPVNFNSITYRMDEGLAYLGSDVLFRKIGESVVDWPVEQTELMKSLYPD